MKRNSLSFSSNTDLLMKINHFKKRIGDLLRAQISISSIVRIENAYEELATIYELIHKYQADAVKLNSSDPDFRGNMRYLALLHKVLFLFADQFVTSILSEAVGERGLTLKKFLKNPRPPLSNLSPTKVLSAYTIVVYRNKIIAHHDVKRIYGLKWCRNLEHFTLAPLPEHFHVAKSDAESLQRLKSKYMNDIAGIEFENNQFAQLNLLFYGIPIGSLRNINMDRQKVNEIAKRGGCESLTSAEVMKAMEEFSCAVTELF